MHELTDAEVRAGFRPFRFDVKTDEDPERDAAGRPQGIRNLQMGVRGAALARYLDEGIAAITDVSAFVESQRKLPADEHHRPNAEKPYPVSAATAARLGMTAAARKATDAMTLPHQTMTHILKG